MRRTLALLLMLASSACSWPARGEVWDEVHGATLRLEVPGGICSGTAVGRYTILTASHCFYGKDGKPTKPRTITANGELCEVWKLTTDKNDHALLVVGGCEFAITAKLGNTAKVGDRVFAWSNPSEFRDILLFGEVAGYADSDLIDAKATLYNLNAYFGSSGGGIFNAQGKLVGVISIATHPYKLMGSFPLAFTKAQMREAGL